MKTQHRDVIVNTQHNTTMRSTMTAVVPAVGTSRESFRAAANAKISYAHLPSCLLDGCVKINPITAKNKWLPLLGNTTDRDDENKPTTVCHPLGPPRYSFPSLASTVTRNATWCLREERWEG
jgi:hypothetical protein